MLLLFSSFYIFTESAIGSYQDSNPPGIHVYSDWQGPMNERRIQRETWIKGIRHTCACEFVSRGTQKMTPLLYAMHSSVPGVIIQYWIIRRKFVGFNENGKTLLFSCDTIDRLQLVMIDSFFSFLFLVLFSTAAILSHNARVSSTSTTSIQYVLGRKHSSVFW